MELPTQFHWVFFNLYIMETLYLCGYSIGQHEDLEDINVFVTANKELADKWRLKLDLLVIKVKAHYKYLADKNYYVDPDRYDDYFRFNYSYCREIECR